MRTLTTYRRNPIADDFFKDFENAFEGFLAPRYRVSTHSSGFFPQLDASEAEDHFLIQIDVPGMKEEDIQVELNGNVLTIAGQRENEHRETGKVSILKDPLVSFPDRFNCPKTQMLKVSKPTIKMVF
ncbi:MAG: Hsp20/alpha crystallin family protein [Bdellovibrionales bacterium]